LIRSPRRRRASVKDQITVRITLFAVGDPNKCVVPGDGEFDAHGEHAYKIPQCIEEVFDFGIGEVIAAEVYPAAMLVAGRPVAVLAKISAAA
jgi:hypothetical protein